MNIFILFLKDFVLKCKGLSDARVTSINKKEHGFAVHFLKSHKFFKGNI